MTTNTESTLNQTSSDKALIFYHAPFSRSGGVLWLLEELGVDYELRRVEMGQAPESYRAIQPHKKVPAIVHKGVVITERAAICAYLGDAFPAAGLAPAIDDPARGPYLSALVYCDAVMDPCIAVNSQNWDYVPMHFSFGGFEDLVNHLERKLASQPYAAGERFTAADTQLGTGLMWTIQMKMFPDRPVFADYIARVSDRPAFKRWQALDAAPVMAIV